MTFEHFVAIQEQLFLAFGWFARWWFIMFAVAGMATAAFMFFLQVVSTWLETYR